MGRSSWPSEPSPPSGERPTFQRLFDVYFKSVLRSIQWMGVPKRNAPDVAQDVFLAVHRALPRLDPTRPVQPWLRTITYRTARDHLRLHHHNREQLLGGSPDLVDPTSNVAEQRLAVDEAVAVMGEVLQCLDEEIQQVFIMHELDEIPMEDIAVALNVPETTVQSWIRRARKEFEAALRRFGAAEEHKRGRTRLLPLLDPTALLAACRALPEVSPELVAQAWRRVVQASSTGPSGTPAGIISLTPAQIAGCLTGALLGGAIAGSATVYALDHASSLAPEVAISAELPRLLVTGIAAPVPPSLGSAGVPAASAQASAAPASPFTLHPELTIIDAARTAFEKGHLDAALASVNRHAQQFPRGLLASEREDLRRKIEAKRKAITL